MKKAHKEELKVIKVVDVLAITQTIFCKYVLRIYISAVDLVLFIITGYWKPHGWILTS